MLRNAFVQFSTGSLTCFATSITRIRLNTFMGRPVKHGAALSGARRPTLKEIKARRTARRVLRAQAGVGAAAVSLAVLYAVWRRQHSPIALPKVSRGTRATHASSLTGGMVEAEAKWAPVYGVKVKGNIPHDFNAFTQGFAWFDGYFYESTGLVGYSSLRQIEASTGDVLQLRKNGREEFAEGVVVADDSGKELIQVLWKVGKGYIWTRDGLTQQAEFSIEGDAWGITRDVQNVIYLSDGSSRIRMYRKEGDTLVMTGSFVVRDGGKEVALLNELEIIEGELWANIWFADLIARIDINTGTVRSWVQCRGILKEKYIPKGHETDVLNGIAYDSVAKRIFVTGKRWPRIFEIEVSKKLVASSVRTLNPFFMHKQQVKEIMASTG